MSRGGVAGGRFLGRSRPLSALAVTAFGLGTAVLLLGLVSGLGHRWGWWDFRTGFLLLRSAALGGLAIALLALLALWRTRPGGPFRGVGWAAAALLLGLLVFAVPWRYYERRDEVPPIHDITTDPSDPPAFVMLAQRPPGTNPVGYGGAEIAAQQQRAYPDIRPLVVDQPFQEVFEQAITAVHAMGWQIVAVAPTEGRIEATDRTFWFGFTDDIVIRVRATEQGTRVDIRSASRVGKSDLGANAARIRAYFATLSNLLA